jgi:hypothetical protein
MSFVRSRAALVARLATRPVLALAALVAAAAPVAAQRVVDGYQYTFRIQTDDDTPVTGRAWVAGDRARIEMDRDESANPGKRRGAAGGLGDDGYLVVTDGGRTLLAVSPSKREYSTTSADEFERMIGTAMQAADRMLTMEVSDLDVTGRRLGPGGPVAGRSTQRGRLAADYESRMGALGFTVRMLNHVEADYWVAPDLQLPRNPLAELMLAVPTVLAQHDRDFTTRMTAGRRALVGDGTPLKVVLTATTRDPDGDTDTNTATYEITSLSRAKVDPTVFAEPKGYRKTEGFSWSVGK